MRSSYFAMLALACTGLASALAITPAAAADAPKCGLSNGKAATGQPIEMGAMSARPVPPTSAARRRRPRLILIASTPTAASTAVQFITALKTIESNPETAAKVAAKLVNDTKVVGMVGSSSFVECATNAKFYATSNVLVIAGVGVPRDCFHSKNIAPTNGGPRMSNIGAAIYMHDNLHVKRLVCIGPNISPT